MKYIDKDDFEREVIRKTVKGIEKILLSYMAEEDFFPENKKILNDKIYNQIKDIMKPIVNQIVNEYNSSDSDVIGSALIHFNDNSEETSLISYFYS